jgi:glycosyltransferase involved in cell wall biosynthesis
MNKISVAIIAKDEERNIERCLRSVQWADEVLVVDTGSTDKTIEICRTLGCRVLISEWLGFGKTKQHAVNAASFDWILSLDADEEVSVELREQIRNVLDSDLPYRGYRLRWKSFYLGAPIRFSGWNPEYHLRMFDRRYGNFNDHPIHESVEVTGEIGHIHADILHHSYPTVQSHITKLNRYTELGAEALRTSGRSATLLRAIASGTGRFLRMYILQLGFLDGKAGLVLAINSAFGVYLKYLKLWERPR